MRLGLLADIHEAVELLANAIDILKSRQVDAFVMLGDVLEFHERIDETVALLADLPGVGVWGNHDLSLCGEVAPYFRSRCSSEALAYPTEQLRSVGAEVVGTILNAIDKREASYDTTAYGYHDYAATHESG